MEFGRVISEIKNKSEISFIAVSDGLKQYATAVVDYLEKENKCPIYNLAWNMFRGL